ncbi:2-oxoglutarate and iron-dependent oxygenase domain-containing protein 3-like [Clavelina lepadiformis]|uniref:2-oxoglutarate and iron-dependent oxygenase domain-containing protein 3-like n=1 Tax=Clavelina lepadiformis TaxID=159417 RepID=UPI004042C6A9
MTSVKKYKKKKPNKVTYSIFSKRYLGTFILGFITSWVVVLYFGIWHTNEPSSNLPPFLPAKYTQNACQNISCSKDYENYPIFAECTPILTCGRCVKDGIVSEKEVESLRQIVKNCLKYGGSSGGASILDLHSGAMSKGEKFVNIYRYFEKSTLDKIIVNKDIETYRNVKNRILNTVAKHFGIDSSKLYLTKPTFFSRMTANPPKTSHDEYWHKHVDKIQYGSFDYTSLVYLSTHSEDFEGGTFVFDDDGDINRTIAPMEGRVSFFTSGSENPHHVERVTSGTRYALTISFTCDPKSAIADPLV